MVNETKWQENMFVLGVGDLIYGYINYSDI